MNNDRQPLYIQIQDFFKKRIWDGELASGDKIPTEKELMQQFDVSRITVANALSELAKEGWIYRVPGRGTYIKEIPDSESKSMNMRQNETSVKPEGRMAKPMIGLIIPALEDFFALQLIQGINNIIENSKYYLTIVLTNNSKELEREAIQELIFKGADGLIIFPVDDESYNEEILSLKIKKYPFVLVDRYLPGVETHMVYSDSKQGTQLAVNHLWEKGHRKIAICSDTPVQTTTVEERINGYMEAIKQKNAMINPALILTDFMVDYSEIQESHPLYRFMKSNMATAYIALNAKLGLYISSIAKRLGQTVPVDISIITFDNPSSRYDESGFFTFIDQSEKEIGKQAAEIVIDIIERQRRDENYQKVILNPKIVIRHSTAPLKQG